MTDAETWRMLSLIAFKYGEISEGRCVQLTKMKREDIRDEMNKVCGKFRPMDELALELAALVREAEKAEVLLTSFASFIESWNVKIDRDRSGQIERFREAIRKAKLA